MTKKINMAIAAFNTSRKFALTKGMEEVCEMLGLDPNTVPENKIARTVRQFENLRRKGIFKKGTVKHLSFSIDGKGDKIVGDCEVIFASLSRTVQPKIVFNVDKIRNAGKITSENNFTHEFISINLGEDIAKTHAKSIFSGEIVLLYKKNSGWVKLMLKVENLDGTISYKDLDNGSAITEATFNKCRTDEYKIFIYKYDPATASKDRNKSGFFRLGDRFESFDKATCGAYSIKMKETKEKLSVVTNEKELNELEEKLKKFSSYGGNAESGTFSLGKVKGYHVYHAAYTNDTVEGFLTNKGKKLGELLNIALFQGNKELEEKVLKALKKLRLEQVKLEKAQTIDGQGFCNSEELSIQLYEVTGYLIAPEALEGLMLQARPATVKMSAVVVNKNVYKAFLRGSRFLAAKNSLGRDTLKAYGNEERSLYVVDMNGVKLPYNYASGDVTFELLGISKCSEGALSKQMMENILVAADNQAQYPEFEELLRELATLTVDSGLASKLDPDKTLSMPSISEVNKAIETGYYRDIFSKSIPSFGLESKDQFETEVKQVLQKDVTIIERMQLLASVESRRLASDPAFILSGGKISGILKMGESFINNANIESSIMFKYPVAGIEEQYASINVSLFTIKDRLAELMKDGVIERVEANSIYGYYKGLGNTVRVLPALIFLTHACAGLDFDYDGESSLVKVANPENRAEEISNLIVDMMMKSTVKGTVILN